MIAIGFEGLKVACIIGCYPEERMTPQEIIIDCKLVLVSQPPQDDVKSSVDYVAVADLIEQVVKTGGYHLLEILVQAVAHALLTTFSMVEQVNLKVRKPSALESRAIPYAQIEVRRS